MLHAGSLLAAIYLAVCGYAWGAATLPIVPQATTSSSTPRRLDVDHPDRDGNTPLMLAAQNGQIKLMESLIAQGADVHARNPRGSVPLVFAMHGSVAAVKLLLSKGAQVDVAAQNGWTPLAWAVHLKRPAMVQVLLAAGANPRAVTGNGQTLLHLAASTGQVDLVRQLLALGLAPAALDLSNETALMYAAEHDHADVVRMLASVSPLAHWNANNDTALTLASKNGHLEVVKALLDAGVPAAGKVGDRAIADAVEAKQPEVVAYLLKRGANVNARGFLGRPLVSLAAWTRQPALASALLAAGADPVLKSDSGQTPLQMAAEWTDAPELVATLLKAGAKPDHEVLIAACGKPRPAMLAVLLAAGVDLGAVTRGQETCLHGAVRSGSVEMVDFVLRQPTARGSLATPDGHGETPLMRAVAKAGPEFTAVLEKLLAAGTPVDGQNADGNTALHLAAEANNAAAIRLLLARGAAQTVNRLGKTPIAWAANWGRLDAAMVLDQASDMRAPRPWLHDLVVNLVERAQDAAGLAKALLHYGDRIDRATLDDALYWAVNGDRLDAARVLLDHGARTEATRLGGPLTRVRSVAMMELLLGRGANVDQRGDDGRTALQEAANKGEPALVRGLLAHGAHPNLEDKYGWNALDYGRATGLADIIHTLERAGGKSARPSSVLWASDVRDGRDRGGFSAAPLVVGDLLIAADDSGILHALNRRTGSQAWQRDLGGTVDHEMRVLDGDLYVTSDSHALYRLRPRDGALVWRHAYSGGRVGSGAWAWRDLLLFAETNGALHAVERQTGQVRWVRQLGDKLAAERHGEDVIRVDGNGLYYVSDSGLRRDDLDTGETHSFAAAEAGPPEIADGLVFLASKDKLYVLDATTLRQRQAVELTDVARLRPLYHDGRLIVPVRDKLLAFTMRPAWSRSFGAGPLGPLDWQADMTPHLAARPVWANDRIYTFRQVKTMDNRLADAPLSGFFTQTRLVSLDPATGREKSALLHGQFSSGVFTPAVTADAVYVLPHGSGYPALALKAQPSAVAPSASVAQAGMAGTRDEQLFGPYFLLYAFTIGLLLVCWIPLLLLLVMGVVTYYFVPDKPRPPSIRLPVPGGKHEKSLHKAAMVALAPELHTMVGREYASGPVFGRTYRFYQWWPIGLFLVIIGTLIGKVLIWPFVHDEWLSAQAALAGQVAPDNPGQPHGWLYAATLVDCFSIFFLPFGGGMFLLWRSRLRKWLRLGDRPQLQIDTQGVTDGGFFVAWPDIVSVQRRAERDSEQKIRLHVILQLRETGRQDREIKVGVTFLDDVPWHKKWRTAPGERFDWQWLHAIIAYHHSYYNALAREQSLSRAPRESGL